MQKITPSLDYEGALENLLYQGKTIDELSQEDKQYLTGLYLKAHTDELSEWINHQDFEAWMLMVANFMDSNKAMFPQQQFIARLIDYYEDSIKDDYERIKENSEQFRRLLSDNEIEKRLDSQSRARDMNREIQYTQGIFNQLFGGL